MPILDLQQRIRELGRIRIGQKVATANGGTRPSKLNRFRLTSPSRELLDRVAKQYGGTVAPWTPDGGTGQFEVITEATRMPIKVPNQPVSQYYELWSGGGCQRRCDGVTELLKDRPCICKAEDPDPQERQCKPTTRLSVVLSEVPGVGVWRLESHGYYAALELPGVAELLAKAGGYVDAFLGLEERTAKREGKTLRWMVPTIDVDITPMALMSGQALAGPAVTGGQERAAITSGQPDYIAEARKCTTPEAVLAVYSKARDAQHGTPELRDTLKAMADRLAETGQQQDAPPAAASQPAEEVHDAEVVEDDDVEAIWFQIIAAAGGKGWTTDQTEQKFAEHNRGDMPGTATAEQLRGFLAAVKAGEIA